MLTFKPQEIGGPSTYKLMIGLIVPRPIALISTLSPNGIPNLAPFSFYNGVSSHPPAIMVSITRKKKGETKDTLRNIETTGEFVVNCVNESILEPMHQSSGEYPYGVNEIEKVGLTAIPSQWVKPPRILESVAHFECQLYKTMEVGDGTEGSATLVVGTLLAIHIDPAIYQDGKILLEKYKACRPISRQSLWCDD